jgi:predicted small integral membrane protein
MRWMAWTLPSAIFFIALGVAITGLLVWELRSPTRERRGFLPIPTTRGDRFFIGLMAAAFIHMLWVGLVAGSPYPATAISLALMAVLGRWG